MNKVIILILSFAILSACTKTKKLTSPDHYIIKSSITEKTRTNVPAEFSIEIIPTDGYEMEVEAPIKLKFDTGSYPDLSFEKELYTKDDLLNKNIKKPIFKGKITPQKAGSYEIKGELSFVVCTSSICEPKKTDIIFKTTVE